MRLYERFALKGYHTSIATTFGIDFDAYENIVLPRLRGAGCHNNILIADNRMLTHALSGASTLPRQAGRVYTVVGAQSTGVFHPKVFLQLGRRGARMIVSSANMTPSGLAGNLELAGEISCDTTESGEQQLIAAAWHYLTGILGESRQSISDQLRWTRSRTPWLRNVEPADGAVTLSDGTEAALLTTGKERGIAAQFVALVGTEAVTRLIVISPYWDDELAALRYLARSMGVPDIAIILDSEECQFPEKALTQLDGVRIFDRKGFRDGRFIHAKAIIAQTSGADHVLFGSGNCTVSALGHETFGGTNEEVCLYRKLPAGLLMQELQLEGRLTAEHAVDPSLLTSPPAAEEIPLDELAAKSPGRFECHYDILIWTPEKNQKPEEVTIELLDTQGKVIDCTLTAAHGGKDAGSHYQISGTDKRPSFARLRQANGEATAPAIVTLIDNLRSVIRETRSKPTENAALQLSEETEEGLWLLEVLDTLEAEEYAQKGVEDPRAVAQAAKSASDEGDPSQYRTLDYEAFIAGRRARADSDKVARNSLAGSELSLVRSFLNRVLGLSAAEEQGESEDDEEAIKQAFNLGDETANAQAAMARGEEFDTNSQPKRLTDKEQEEEQRRRRYLRRKATQDRIVQSVAAFYERIKERKTKGGLGPFDMLRLRALLMIVTSAGWAGRVGVKGSQARTSLQVLASEGDEHSWPRLLGRTVFAVFGSNDPAIKHLKIDVIHDQMTDDLMECWATSFWCLQAALSAPVSHKERAALERYLKPLAVKVYSLTGLTSEELLSDDIKDVFIKLSEQFGKRLRVNPESVWGAHKSLSTELLTKTS